MYAIVLALALLIPTLASSQEKKTFPPINLVSCENDKAKFCPNIKDSLDVATCLVANDKAVSSICMEELEKELSARKKAISKANGPLAAFGAFNAMGPAMPMISYEGRYSPGGTPPVNQEHRIHIAAPIYKSATDTITTSLNSYVYQLGRELTLNNGRKVPQNLYRAEATGHYFTRLADKRNWGLRASYGYAGAKLFQNSDSFTYSASFNYGYPSSDKGQWMAFVFFSNNSPLGNLIPIPGVSYMYRGEKFIGMFGIPVAMMQWTPFNDWAFTFSMFGPNINTEIGYGNIERFQLFTTFNMGRHTYIEKDRIRKKDRLTTEEKKVALGMRLSFWNALNLELQFGNSFDRSVYISNGLFGKKEGYVGIPAALFGSMALRYRF